MAPSRDSRPSGVAATGGGSAIDWTNRESVRAKLRAIVRRILRRYGYPPDRQGRAVETVLEQAEALSAEWTGEGR